VQAGDGNVYECWAIKKWLDQNAPLPNPPFFLTNRHFGQEKTLGISSSARCD